MNFNELHPLEDTGILWELLGPRGASWDPLGSLWGPPGFSLGPVWGLLAAPVASWCLLANVWRVTKETPKYLKIHIEKATGI